jgi:AcrR family transcriptional regulator
VIHEHLRTPRERRHEDNLRRILDTAMRMVEAGGVEAVSINKLADEVDYTPGALYRYFGSKDALLSKLVERILVDVNGYLARGLALLPPKARPLARVVVLVASYRAFARREPQRFGVLAVTMADPRVLLRDPADAAPLAGLMVEALGTLASALDAAAEAGHLDAGDAAERALCVFALLQGASQMEKQARRAAAMLGSRAAPAPGAFDVDRVAMTGTRALLLGFGARAKAVDTAVDVVASLGDLSVQLGGAS